MATQDKEAVKNTENEKGGEGEGEGNDEPIIPGTTYRTPEEAAKGFNELKTFADRQGNEIGELRSQLEETQAAIEQMRTTQTEKQAAESKVDYDAELSKIYEEMANLDDMDDNYKGQMVKLSQKANQLSRQAAREEAKNAAADDFKKALEERDQQQAYQQFYEQNPDFNTPEMQQRIKQQIAKDKTGMSDPLVAYREIQRDDAVAKAQELETELAEAKRLLDLKGGTDSTGKVVAKGQAPGDAQKTKQEKLTGADLDAKMREAARTAAGG